MCHPRSLTFFTEHVKLEQVRGKRVLEVGSYNVNGTMRTVVEPMGPAKYIGVDLRPGPCVDLVLDFSLKNVVCPSWNLAGDEIKRSPEFDLVICVASMEHCKNWRQFAQNLKDSLLPGGLMHFSVPTPGFTYHDPPDYWRFTPEQCREMFSDWEILQEEITTSPYLVQYILRKPSVPDLDAIEPFAMPQPVQA